LYATSCHSEFSRANEFIIAHARIGQIFHWSRDSPLTKMNFVGAGCSRLKSIECNDRRLNDIAPAIDCHSDFNVIKGNVKTKLNALLSLSALISVHCLRSLVPARCDVAQDALNCSRPPCRNMKPRLT